MTGRGSFCAVGLKTVPFSRTPSRIGILNAQMRSIPPGFSSFAGWTGGGCCVVVADWSSPKAFGAGWAAARLDHNTKAGTEKQQVFMGLLPGRV
jgi:hypothetical protein